MSASLAASTSWASNPSASACSRVVVAAHAHDRFAAAVAQVERPRPSLVAVADHRRRARPRSHRRPRRARSRWWSPALSVHSNAPPRLMVGSSPRPIFSARCIIRSPLDSVLSWMMNLPVAEALAARSGRARRDRRPSRPTPPSASCVPGSPTAGRRAGAPARGRRAGCGCCSRAGSRASRCHPDRTPRRAAWCPR